MLNKRSDLPQHIRKALPAPAQDAFLAAYNDAEAGDPSNRVKANGAAWTAIRNGWAFDGAFWAPIGRAEPKTLYVSRPLLNAADLADWAKGQGFSSTVDDMHVTVAFSRDPVDRGAFQPADDEMTINGGGRAVEALGDEGAVVLRFKAVQLDKRWQEFRDGGASWDWDSYRSHVTITYNGAPESLDSIEPYSGPLVFGPEEFAEIDDDKTAQAQSKSDPRRATVAKVDKALGIVFGWAVVCKIDGEPYYDLHGSYIPEDVMIRSAADFMSATRVAGDMHSRDKFGAPIAKGEIVFAWPMTEDIKESMKILHSFTGLMIGMKPNDPAILEKFASGEYTGFSVGGMAETRDIE